MRIRLLDALPTGSATSTLRDQALAAARDDVLADASRFGPYGAPELDSSARELRCPKCGQPMRVERVLLPHTRGPPWYAEQRLTVQVGRC